MDSVLRTPSGPFKCTRCSKGYKTKEPLGRHSKMCQEKPYPCASCNRHFADTGSLTAHENTHSSSRKKGRFTCDRGGCQSTFATKSILKKHDCGEDRQPKKLLTLKIKTGGSEPPVECQFTPDSCSSLSSSSSAFPAFVTMLPDSDPLKRALKDELRGLFEEEDDDSSSSETVWEAKEVVAASRMEWQVSAEQRRLPQHCRPLIKRLSRAFIAAVMDEE